MFLTNHSDIKPLDNIFLEVGPFSIAWYAVLILTGAMVALALAIQEGKKIGIDSDFLIDLVLFGIPISVVGARLLYVFFEWERYKNNPVDIIKINQGGLAIYGAVIAAVTWGYFFAKKKNVNFLRVIDLGAVGFLIAQAIGRWGNFMNQEAHGGLVPGENLDQQRAYLESLRIPEFIINQMYIRNGKVAEGVYQTGYFHPTFLYESIWNILGLILLLILRRTKKLYVGDLGLIYLMWYSVGRFTIEEMRTDAMYIWNTDIRAMQVLTAITFVAGAAVLILRHYKKWYPKYYYELLEEHQQEEEVIEVDE